MLHFDDSLCQTAKELTVQCEVDKVSTFIEYIMHKGYKPRDEPFVIVKTISKQITEHSGVEWRRRYEQFEVFPFGVDV